MAFKTPVCYNNPMKLVSESSLSTQSLQPKVVLDPNSKWIGMGSEVPWQTTRSGIDEANGAQEMSVFHQQRSSHTWLGNGSA